MPAAPEASADCGSQPPAAAQETPSAPRNRAAFAIGRRRRDLIRTMLLERAQRFPLAKALTAKQIRHQLRAHGVYLAETTIRWHVESIRAEADREAASSGCAE